MNRCSHCDHSEAWWALHHQEDAALNLVATRTVDLLILLKRGAVVMPNLSTEYLETVQALQEAVDQFNNLPVELAEAGEQLLELERSLAERT